MPIRIKIKVEKFSLEEARVRLRVLQAAGLSVAERSIKMQEIMQGLSKFARSEIKKEFRERIKADREIYFHATAANKNKVTGLRYKDEVRKAGSAPANAVQLVEVLAPIALNLTNQLQIRVMEDKGEYKVDVRQWFVPPGKTEFEGTRRGFRIKVALIDDLIARLERVKKKYSVREDENI